jgi:hypothetical protein
MTTNARPKRSAHAALAVKPILPMRKVSTTRLHLQVTNRVVEVQFNYLLLAAALSATNQGLKSTPTTLLLVV